MIEAISPKHKTGHTEVVNLALPTEDDATAGNNNETLFVKTKLQQKSGTEQTKKSNTLQDDEEYESLGKEIAKADKQAEKRYVKKSYRDYKTQTCQS